MDDWQLLQSYATGNSEEAFRSLVDRYAGMVYHAALRQTGNPHAAEEAAQTVFIALAQKAGRIPRQATLYGWLFRATRFAVSNQARKNATRERNEQEAVVMQTATETDDVNSVWEQITPELNDALDKLSAPDREALMIRYFGNKSHKDVADALGISEDTARKRISRAIEKLRATFTRRGIAVTSLALTGALAAHGAKAAPMDSVSSWANTAMSTAATGAASGGILSLVSAVKIPALISVVAGLVFLGGAGVAIFLAHRSPAPALPTASPIKPDLRVTDSSLPKPPAPAAINPPSASALDKVRAALHDPIETPVYSNPVMRDAIAGLADNKKAAVPILEGGAKDADAQVRLRAVDGLGMIGPEAAGAAPSILAIIRDGGVGQEIHSIKYSATRFGSSREYPIYADNILLYSLAQIHPQPETLSELARLIKEDAAARNIVFQAVNQFRSARRDFQSGGWLWEIAGENAAALNQAFVPLLKDSDDKVRSISALALVSALGDQADPAVFPVANEMLKSDDDIFRRQYGLRILEEASHDSVNYVPTNKSILYAPRLGPYLNDTVAALADAAFHSKREGIRMKASKMLDVLSPNFRKLNPPIAAELEKQEETEQFINKVLGGEASKTEILAGLKKYPKAAPFVANYLNRTGSNAVEYLPAFTEALDALAPDPKFDSMDNLAGVNQRQRLADAMQEIAPDRPKILFTVMDTRALRIILRDPALQSDAARFQKVSNACQQAGWPEDHPGQPFDSTPQQVQRLLAAVKTSDTPTYDALVAKVKEIDPHFFDGPNSPESPSAAVR